MLLADDILDTSSPLSSSLSTSLDSQRVYLDLESFRCVIGGIPRPDLQQRLNGWELFGPLHDPNIHSQHDSRMIQRKVLAQVGRLTQLRELVLGSESIEVDLDRCMDGHCTKHSRCGHCRFNDYPPLDDAEFCKLFELDGDPCQQYHCLTMTLDDVPYQLQGLKRMKKLTVHGLSHAMGVKEDSWIRRHWPEYNEEWEEPFWRKPGYVQRPRSERWEPESIWYR
jgi:hypothetical protein